MEEQAGHYRGVPRDVKRVNAANFGMPEKHMRVFFVAFRADQDTLWQSPSEKHNGAALLLSQWASSEYWERYKVAMRHQPPRPEVVDEHIPHAG
jgi:DNA (cytosine-5)-methyltransferase 1